jgi:hypothetical protein
VRWPTEGELTGGQGFGLTGAGNSGWPAAGDALAGSEGDALAGGGGFGLAGGGRDALAGCRVSAWACLVDVCVELGDDSPDRAIIGRGGCRSLVYNRL